MSKENQPKLSGFEEQKKIYNEAVGEINNFISTLSKNLESQKEGEELKKKKEIYKKAEERIVNLIKNLTEKYM
jgi:exonuclease VII small subunit